MLGGNTALVTSVATDSETRFLSRPTVTRTNGKAKLAFAVSGPTDVEIAILNARGGIVRHLAAGALGGKTPPPAPLKPGLKQEIEWDLRTDTGKPAAGGPFKARVAGRRSGPGLWLCFQSCRLSLSVTRATLITANRPFFQHKQAAAFAALLTVWVR